MSSRSLTLATASMAKQEGEQLLPRTHQVHRRSNFQTPLIFASADQPTGDARHIPGGHSSDRGGGRIQIHCSFGQPQARHLGEESAPRAAVGASPYEIAEADKTIPAAGTKGGRQTALYRESSLAHFIGTKLDVYPMPDLNWYS